MGCWVSAIAGTHITKIRVMRARALVTTVLLEPILLGLENLHCKHWEEPEGGHHLQLHG
jgi:hypothetical protein